MGVGVGGGGRGGGGGGSPTHRVYVPMLYIYPICYVLYALAFEGWACINTFAFEGLACFGHVYK